MTKQDAYEKAALINLSDSKGTRMDVVILKLSNENIR